MGRNVQFYHHEFLRHPACVHPHPTSSALVQWAKGLWARRGGAHICPLTVYDGRGIFPKDRYSRTAPNTGFGGTLAALVLRNGFDFSHRDQSTPLTDTTTPSNRIFSYTHTPHTRTRTQSIVASYNGPPEVTQVWSARVLSLAYPPHSGTRACTRIPPRGRVDRSLKVGD